MSQSQQQPKYRFYPTLLDAFQWYLDSEQETAFPDLIDRINRVPFQSDAADKGTAFNEVVDARLRGEELPHVADLYTHNGFNFAVSIVEEFVKELAGAVSQVRVSGTVETQYGIVELYGVMDEWIPGGNLVDIKTTGSYDVPKYLKNWQRIIYPYCMLQRFGGGPWSFAFLVTDFKDIFLESYVFNPEPDTERLRAVCHQFIEFIEEHRHLITDQKVFGGASVIVAQRDNEVNATIITADV